MATRLERLMFAIGMRDEASSKMGKLRKAITGMTETVHDQFLRVGTGAMGAYSQAQGIHQLVAPAIDLNRAMGEVSSLDVDNSSLASLQASAKQFAMDYGGSAADVVRASYDIQSAIAGLKGNELGTFSVASGVLARATKADVGVITSYMGTMYGIFKDQADRMGKAQWVEQLTGQTALAVQMFKTKGPEMSAAFTALGANAKAAGIAASEQIAILGTLQSTMGGSEAGTKYKAFLAGVGNAQKELGLKFTDKGGNMLGMVAILDKLKGKFGDTLNVAESDALKKAFGSDEAVSLIKQLMTDSTGLAKSIDSLGKVQGMDKAREMASKMTDVWHKGSGAIGVLAASFGQQLLPPLEKLVGKGVDVMKTMVRWIDIAPNLARWIGYGAITVMALAAVMGVLSAAIAINKIAWLALGGPVRLAVSLFGLLRKLTFLQTAATWLLNTSLYGCPMIWVVIGVVALIAAVGALIYWWDDLKAAFLDTSWGKAIMATIDSLMAPFKLLGETWDWISQKFGFSSSTEVTAKAQAAARSAEIPKAPAMLSSINAPRSSEIPVGGVLANNSTLNRSNSRQTTIGSVTIHSEQPMTSGQLDEWAALQAG
ncbi:MAG: phage tail tape measure protein [Proteobacteria bacterium]|nr:phage tail tape measure protein [Pseudomonadota bacterium]